MDTKFHRWLEQTDNYTINAVFGFAEDVSMPLPRVKFIDTDTGEPVTIDVTEHGGGEKVGAFFSYNMHVLGHGLTVTMLFKCNESSMDLLLTIYGGLTDDIKAALCKYQPDLEKPILDWEKIDADVKGGSASDDERRLVYSGMFRDGAIYEWFITHMYEHAEDVLGLYHTKRWEQRGDKLYRRGVSEEEAEATCVELAEVEARRAELDKKKAAKAAKGV